MFTNSIGYLHCAKWATATTNSANGSLHLFWSSPTVSSNEETKLEGLGYLTDQEAELGFLTSGFPSVLCSVSICPNENPMKTRMQDPPVRTKCSPAEVPVLRHDGGESCQRVLNVTLGNSVAFDEKGHTGP